MALPNDPLFNLLWYLKNTGQAGGVAGYDINVEKAWDNYTGTGIKVGVYDDGVEITHPDLAANYNAALQPTINGTPHAGTPVTASDNHGTPVAGLIVARGNNGIGVLGVAYTATFGTARYLGADNATGAALLGQQTLYDVANHSWGSTRNWFGDGPIETGFKTGADTGRNGLGTSMLKAAGNERVGTPGGDEPVGRDANDSAYNSSRYITLIGATQNTGFVAEYSSPSAALLVSAPGGAGATGLDQDVTTDRAGTAGYNNGSGTPNGQPDYAAFNGTSAATPIASGVAALILQANPNLGWRDVQAILAYSARHVGSAVGGIAQGSELDSWQFNAAKNWNGAGLHFSNDYGFGLVDATTAVRLAENWLAFSPAQVSTNEVTATNSITQAAQAIPDNNATGLTFNITMTGAISIEQMAVKLQLNHTAVGDLSIDLIAPSGVTSNIWLRTNAGTPINADWTFATREFYGEAVAGTWTVRIRDLGTLGTGTIGNISLTAYGETLTADTHYIYTPEFATYTRSTLTDASGIDIFDAGSIMTASTIDLRSGNTSTLAGKNMVITAGTVIEHAFGGDGNDTIFGNTADNTIRGGRGNDVIDAGLGVDTAGYLGQRSAFQIIKSGGNYQVFDQSSGFSQGTDTLTGVERFQFVNATVGAETLTPSSFNGDLKSDLLWINKTFGLAVGFLMDGNTIQSASAIGGANGAAWQVRAVGDLNGDGQSDLIWQNNDGLVVAYLMNGLSIASAAVIGNATSAFKVVGSGDLNGDGKSDIIVQNNNGLAVGWLMDGATITAGASFGAANGASWNVRAIGDLDGDGKADIVWNDNTGTTVGYLMNGLSITSAAVIAGANGAGFSVRDAGDMNGDGKADLVWQYATGQAGAWIMNGTSITTGNLIGAANGAQWEIRNVSDLNGDSLMDLVWQDTTNGQSVGFLMTGLSISSAALIGGANGADWFIV